MREGQHWQLPPKSLVLPTNEVHVWRANLDVDPAALGRLAETNSVEERVRAARFHSSIHQKRYTAARGILRVLLERYLGISPSRFTFTQNAHGKPLLVPTAGTADLRFNLSHSQNIALFAFALGREVGVDVESIRPAPMEDRLVERFFSPQEGTELHALAPNLRQEGFFQCWTRKEAYIKARGAGLSMGLASFTVPLGSEMSEPLPIAHEGDAEDGQWWLRPIEVCSGYAGAVVAVRADWRPVLWQFELDGGGL